MIVKKDRDICKLDVSFIFTNFPTDQYVKVIHKILQQNKTLKDRTVLSPDTVVKLFKVCLRSSYLSYGGAFMN